jgi:hypothetical protein
MKQKTRVFFKIDVLEFHLWKKDFVTAIYFSEAPFPPKLLSWGGQAIL